ncbi:helix-turn-helix domain-containing protein [Streptomyces sp. NPDC048650]|uniref:MmyB family transcriptional regulator n=1 Tax=unclassified Streptomyces TaxID=2593676 RepID=UPI00371E3EC0
MKRHWAFRELCKARRAALQPEDVGLEPRPPRRGPKVKGLTQAEVDRAMGGGSGTYGKVEAGLIRPSPEYLLHLARLLRFKASEFEQSHLDLFGTPTGLMLNPDAHSEIPAAYQRKVDAQPHMCYVQNRRWEPIYWNDAFVRLFPSRRVPANLAEWWLLSDEARDPETGVMPNWGPDWGRFLVPQFRASLSAFPKDPVLQRVNALVTRDPLVQKLYECGENAYIHPDGDRRRLRHGELGLGWATLLSVTPQSAPGCREMTVIFDPDDHPAADDS